MHVVPWDNDMLVHAAVEVDSFFWQSSGTRRWSVVPVSMSVANQVEAGAAAGAGAADSMAFRRLSGPRKAVRPFFILVLKKIEKLIRSKFNSKF
jgi:hypothetical protein